MEPFVGEIRCFAFGKTPQGWVPCDGRALPVNGNQALYSLIMNLFGGDNKNFNVPDLRGRAPFHYNPSGASLLAGNVGTQLGEENVTVTPGQMPVHTHPIAVKNAAGDKDPPQNGVFAAASAPHQLYGTGTSAPLAAMASDSVLASGGGAAHSNMQPFAVVNFCIAAVGIYPMRND